VFPAAEIKLKKWENYQELYVGKNFQKAGRILSEDSLILTSVSKFLICGLIDWYQYFDGEFRHYFHGSKNMYYASYSSKYNYLPIILKCILEKWNRGHRLDRSGSG
jgi:hypothetical protein